MAKPTRSLVDHTADVVAAFEALFGAPSAPTSFAARWLAFFRIEASEVTSFLRVGLLACYVHDWGKANSGFAGMLTRTTAQTVRHEVVSALILAQPKVSRWLESAEGVDLPVVLAAVVGHHLKAAEPKAFSEVREFGARQAGSLGADFTLTWDHPKIREQLTHLAQVFGIERPIPEGVPRLWSVKSKISGSADYTRERDKVIALIEDFCDDIEDRPESPRARMLRAVRSALIASDSAGSALFRTNESTWRGDQIDENIRSWIREAFDPLGSLDEGRIQSAILDPRIAKSTRGDREFQWNEFQQACDDPTRVPPRALLIAPCGSGKTLAAWRWVAARCRERPVGRAVFLYPTRGTATEGFRDYVSHAGPDLAALVHGTARLDLERLQPDIDPEAQIAQARLFSLGQWPKRIFSATVDQFLAFLQHDYGSTCLLPLLADSAVVLDEVHSYDRGMFTALLQFLEHFDVPVLAMTATMNERRKADLARHLTVVDGLRFGDDTSRLRQAADHRRYEVARVTSGDEAMQQAQKALKADLRVLWVVNTVDRAQDRVRAFTDNIRAEPLMTGEGVPIHCYHSRFKLCDRRDRHEAVIAAFKRNRDTKPTAVLAVTTQVCELSLDLDCDLLITEFSPISALIQRFGRCCRDPEAHETNPKRTGRVVLYVPDSVLPYNKEEMTDVDRFVADIDGNIVSQSALEAMLVAMGGTSFLAKNARFITDGPWAAAGQDHFRDAEELTCPALMPCDELNYRALIDGPMKWRAQELILPIPRSRERGARDDSNRPPWMPSWLTFADAKRHEYSALVGYIARAGGGHQIA